MACFEKGYQTKIYCTRQYQDGQSQEPRSFMEQKLNWQLSQDYMPLSFCICS